MMGKWILLASPRYTAHHANVEGEIAIAFASARMVSKSAMTGLEEASFAVKTVPLSSPTSRLTIE